jgi:hypothetical protein
VAIDDLPRRYKDNIQTLFCLEVSRRPRVPAGFRNTASVLGPIGNCHVRNSMSTPSYVVRSVTVTTGRPPKFDTLVGHSGGMSVDRQIELNSDILAFLKSQVG